MAVTPCGDGEAGSAGSGSDRAHSLGELADATFLSTKITQGGVDRRLVDGTRISLRFWESRLSAQAGCNTLGGDAALRDGVIEVVGGLMMTEMGCPPQLMRQDNWLARLLSRQPTATLADDRLTLSSGDTVIEFLNEETATPDRELTGTMWTLDAVGGSSPDASVASVPAGVVSTLAIDVDGRVSIRPGCNSGRGRAAIGDATIEFGPLALTRMACRGAAMDIEASVLTVLDGTVRYTIDVDRLTLTNGDDQLVYRAR
jgi:heat shock protein HslJ